jgi:hypothetical protein
LGAFNLRGKNGFFANVGVDEQRQIRENGRETVEPPYCLIGLFQELLQSVEAQAEEAGERRDS